MAAEVRQEGSAWAVWDGTKRLAKYTGSQAEAHARALAGQLVKPLKKPTRKKAAGSKKKGKR